MTKAKVRKGYVHSTAAWVVEWRGTAAWFARWRSAVDYATRLAKL